MKTQIKHALKKRLRSVIVGLIIIFQVIILSALMFSLSNKFIYVYFLFWGISLASAIVIVNKAVKPEFKITWIIMIMLFPIFGGVFYIFFGANIFNRKLKFDMVKSFRFMTNKLEFNNNNHTELKNKDKNHYKQSLYLSKLADAPLYKNTYNKYLCSGEEKFKIMIEEIKKAKKYIFLEYFIIDEGIMWHKVLTALKEKVDEGVDVRIIYDDAGCMATLPFKYNNYLKSIGIKCKIFNPFRLSMSIILNYRNHRKMFIVDGNVAITGGVNLADEYINEKERFGHWKDAGILLKGDAVYYFTIMFLHFWNFDDTEDTDFTKFLPSDSYNDESYGYVQPYCDSPMDNEPVGQSVYLNIINNAKSSVNIYTPYFIVDSEMLMAICLAAKSGIEVNIIVPHIPDKKMVNLITKSYYSELLDAGVNVFEYKKGFIHSKCILVDDDIGVIGTINFDYRSLYHHFECGVLLFGTPSLTELKVDFDKTIEESIKVDDMDINKIYSKNYIRWILKIFAPLM